MSKYTFNWTITPVVPADYNLSMPPFNVILRGTTLTLFADADPADEKRLEEQADRAAHNLARSLSYKHTESFQVAFGIHEVETAGRRHVFIRATSGGVSVASGRLDFELRDADGNVVDSSALQRERERQATQQHLADLAMRADRDPNLRDMLDHWSRYVADPDGRLHPLFDILEVAERLYRGRKRAARSLNVKKTDLDDLAHFSNDPMVLNGRHPGNSPGPHRVATESEVTTCERVARTVIEHYARQIVV